MKSIFSLAPFYFLFHFLNNRLINVLSNNCINNFLLNFFSWDFFIKFYILPRKIFIILWATFIIYWGDLSLVNILLLINCCIGKSDFSMRISSSKFFIVERNDSIRLDRQAENDASTSKSSKGKESSIILNIQLRKYSTQGGHAYLLDQSSILSCLHQAKY